MSEMDQIDVLAECIEAIESGRLTIAQCIAQYPQHQASLEALLPLAETLRHTPEAAPSPLFRQQARQRLLKQLPLSRVPFVDYFVDYMRSFFSRMSLAGGIVTVLLALLFMGSGVAFAANSAAPGDALYGLDRSIENARLRLAGDGATAVALQTAFAQERLTEATKLAARGDTANAEIALSSYRETMAKLGDSSAGDKVTGNALGGNGRLVSPAFVSGDCTYSQGYWKNHPGDWPVTDLTLGGVAYSQAELLVILHTSPQGDATYILAHQLIAAQLNIANGADPSAVATELAAADAWLAVNPIGSDPDGDSRQEGIALAGTLDSYNNGLIGPGHCDGITPTPTATATMTATVTITPTPTMTATVTPTPTVTITPTVTPTPTVTITPTPTVTITPTVPPPTVAATPDPTSCTGANPHPHGTTLANQFGVPYEEIMGWFCSGFGFGEIERAYNLSAETGTAVADIFAMRQSGLGWGQIRRALTGSNGNNGNNGNGNNGNNGNGNNGNGNGQGNNANNGNGGNNGNNGNGNNGNNGNGNGQGNGNNGNSPGNSGHSPGNKGNGGKKDK